MERILIADDVSVDRRILIALLGEDYEVVETKNGREAIEQLKESSDGFDCLLLDIAMPEVDGFGVLEFMREREFLEKVPVIALTALTHPEDHARCSAAGVADLLEKPYDQQILKCKIRDTIARFRTRTEARARKLQGARA